MYVTRLRLDYTFLSNLSPSILPIFSFTSIDPIDVRLELEPPARRPSIVSTRHKLVRSLHLSVPGGRRGTKPAEGTPFTAIKVATLYQSGLMGRVSVYMP